MNMKTGRDHIVAWCLFLGPFYVAILVTLWLPSLLWLRELFL